MLATPVWAQVRVQFVQGEAKLDGKLLPVSRQAAFPDQIAVLTAVQRLSTGAGRAEVLLSPGVVLRVAEHCSILLDFKNLKLESGAALIEIIEARPLIVESVDKRVRIDKPGIWPFGADNLDLRQWSQERARVLAMANVSAAKAIADSKNQWREGGWWWNPYFGIHTYVPSRNKVTSPFGYPYFSPAAVGKLFEPMAAYPVYEPQ
jgi:hypothetical protein